MFPRFFGITKTFSPVSRPLAPFFAAVLAPLPAPEELPERQNAVLQVIKNFKSPDRAVIVVSHDLEDIFNVADRVVVMRNGRIVGDRPTAETSADEIVALMTFGSYAERGGEPPRG